MVAGGVWTVFWHVIISILAILIWGIPMSLQIASTLIAGMLAGAFVVLKRPRRGYTYHFFGLMITVFLVLIFTFGHIFRLGSYQDAMKEELKRVAAMTISFFFAWFFKRDGYKHSLAISEQLFSIQVFCSHSNDSGDTFRIST